MEQKFDSEAIQDRIAAMPRWKAIAFGLGACERMLPSFHVFAEPIGYEGEAVLRESLDAAWEMLDGGEDRRDMMRAAKACDSVAPDMDEYGDVKYGFAAMNAACAIALLMDSISGDMEACASIIASLAIEVVDMLAQSDVDHGDAGHSVGIPDDRILVNPLMQAELRRQRADMEFLETIGNDLSATAPALKDRWRNSGGNILGESSTFHL